MLAKNDLEEEEEEEEEGGNDMNGRREEVQAPVVGVINVEELKVSYIGFTLPKCLECDDGSFYYGQAIIKDSPIISKILRSIINT